MDLFCFGSVTSEFVGQGKEYQSTAKERILRFRDIKSSVGLELWGGGGSMKTEKGGGYNLGNQPFYFQGHRTDSLTTNLLIEWIA